MKTMEPFLELSVPQTEMPSGIRNQTVAENAFFKAHIDFLETAEEILGKEQKFLLAVCDNLLEAWRGRHRTCGSRTTESMEAQCRYLAVRSPDLAEHFFKKGWLKENHSVEDVLARIREQNGAADDDLSIALDDFVTNTAADNASSVNNGGVAEQIRWLLENDWTPGEIIEAADKEL